MLRATNFGKRLMERNGFEDQVRLAVRVGGIKQARTFVMLISASDENGIPKASDEELADYYREEQELVDRAIAAVIGSARWIT